jgi:hypothetical protein
VSRAAELASHSAVRGWFALVTTAHRPYWPRPCSPRMGQSAYGRENPPSPRVK